MRPAPTSGTLARCPFPPDSSRGAIAGAKDAARRSTPGPPAAGRPAPTARTAVRTATRRRGTGKVHPLLIPLTAAARRYLVAFDDALAHPESQTALGRRRRLLLVLRRDRPSPPSDSNR